MRPYRRLFSEAGSDLEKDIKKLIPKIVNVAQEEYDAWDESDEDTYAGGGICHLIAERITEICQTIPKTIVTVYTYSDVQHVVTVVGRLIPIPDAEPDEDKYDKECHIVDIPYYHYEKGGGYSWTKIPNVIFKPSMVRIDYAEFDEFFTESGDIID